MKKFSKWIALAVVLVVAITLPLVLRSIGQRQEIRKKAAPETTLSLKQSTNTVGLNHSFPLDAALEPGSNQVTTVELHVAYDPTLLQVTAITPAAALPVILTPAAIDNASGSASITLGATPLQPVSSPSIIATFTFQTRGTEGSTQVTYSSQTMASALGETGNVIASLIPAGVTIGAAVITPTPTPNPCAGKPNGDLCQISSCIGGPCEGEKCPAAPCYAAPGTCQNQTCVISGATPTPPPGCSYQQVQCFREPCEPVLVCPTPAVTNPCDGRQNGDSCQISDCPICTGYPCPLRPCSIAFGTCSNNVCLANTPTPTPTLTPTPTPTPVPEVWNFLLKFSGVPGGNAVGANVTIRFVNSTINLVTPPIPVSYNGNGVYQASLILNPSQLPPGPGYNIIVKGEKHIARKYCQFTGQTQPCSAGQSFTIPATFTSPSVTLDFTGLALDPGDLPTQDNKADSGDFDKIKTLMNKACSALTEGELLTGDLNYDGCVNTLDAFLMRKTLEIRYDEN